MSTGFPVSSSNCLICSLYHYNVLVINKYNYMYNLTFDFIFVKTIFSMKSYFYYFKKKKKTPLVTKYILIISLRNKMLFRMENLKFCTHVTCTLSFQNLSMRDHVQKLSQLSDTSKTRPRYCIKVNILLSNFEASNTTSNLPSLLSCNYDDYALRNRDSF